VLPLVLGPGVLLAAERSSPLGPFALAYPPLFALGEAAALDLALRKRVTGRAFLGWAVLPAAVALFLVLQLAWSRNSAEIATLCVPVLLFVQHLVLAYPIVVQQNLRARNLEHSAPEHHVGMLSALLLIAGVLPNGLIIGLVLTRESLRFDVWSWGLIGYAFAPLVAPIIGYRRFFADRLSYDGQRLSFASRVGVVVHTLWQMRLSLVFFLVTGCTAVYVVMLGLVRD